MENEKEALAISAYLHTLDVCKPLAWYMARGLSIELAKVVVAASEKRPCSGEHKCDVCGKEVTEFFHYGCARR